MNKEHICPPYDHALSFQTSLKHQALFSENAQDNELDKDKSKCMVTKVSCHVFIHTLVVPC